MTEYIVTITQTEDTYFNGCQRLTRCRDCKYYMPTVTTSDYFCARFSHVVCGNDYCSKAVRFYD